MRRPAVLGILLLLLGCAASRPTGSSRPPGWSIARPPQTHVMSDSTYDRLSRVPEDSLTTDQRSLLDREARERARVTRGTTLWVKALLVAAVFATIAFLGRYGGI
jgi:hypothetical protein